MPLFTNIGGKLVEIKSLNTTTGDMLKPIYGTPKENLTLHWGGFTGESNDQYMLIGTITLNCPTYVSVLLEIPDNTANTLFNTVPTDDTIPEFMGLDLEEYHYEVTYSELATISFNDNKYTLTNSKTYLRTSSGWSLEKDFVKNTKLTSPILVNNSTTENLYEVEVNRKSYCKVYKIHTSTDSLSNTATIAYYPMDGMTADFTFTFQTLNND